jgi:hypothetical protein
MCSNLRLKKKKIEEYFISGSAAQPGEEKKASEKELKAPEGKVQLLFCTAHAPLQHGGWRRLGSRERTWWWWLLPAGRAAQESGPMRTAGGEG